MKNRKFIFLILLVSLFFNFYFISAAECGSVPVKGCTVSVSTTFNAGTYFFNGTSTSDPIITISGNNLRLDCNGAHFKGNSTTYGRGIYVNQAQNVSIVNCYIEGYYRGIYIRGFSKNITLDNLGSYNAGSGVYTDNSNKIYVINSNITLSSKGIYVLNTSELSISTTIFKNDSYSIYLNSSSNGIIQDNDISDGLRDGTTYADIAIEESNFTKILDNTINNGGYRGIYLNNYAEHSEVAGNIINGSYQDAIALYNGADYNEVHDNFFTSSNNNGISMRSSNSHFYNNLIDKNTHHGMDLRADVYTFGADNNTVENNIFSNQVESHFIYITQGRNNIIKDNQFINQSGASDVQDGVEISNLSNGNKIIGNTFVNIHRYGIQFIYGTKENVVQDNDFSKSTTNYTYFFVNSTNDSIKFLGESYYINTSKEFRGWINESAKQINNTYTKSQNLSIYGLTDAKLSYDNGTTSEKDGDVEITFLPYQFFVIIDKFYSPVVQNNLGPNSGGSDEGSGGSDTNPPNISETNESIINQDGNTTKNNSLENKTNETTDSTEIIATLNSQMIGKVLFWGGGTLIIIILIALIIFPFLKIKSPKIKEEHL
ncbi:Right handed beta helix region [uncultured archaeon]|nr:Right handed beta helix region [uncultured archaeon]